MDGHALTLQILGQFLVRAFHGDIRRRDRIDLQKADAKIQGGHAFRVMGAYATWLEQDSDESRRQLALLSLLGLFDRPATADCLDALRRAPVIPGLTESLVGLADDDWELSLSALCDAKLLSVNRAEGSGDLLSLDAHPLLREYFAGRLRDEQPEAWRAGHRRLYEHLCASTHESAQPTLEDLQPLYQAVGHGCHAGLQQDACDKVYYGRIKRWNEHYTSKKLGAFGSNLGAVACFFELPWSRVSPTFSEADQAWLLSEAAIGLRALSRLTEALTPMRTAAEQNVEREAWRDAAASVDTVSQLELTLGEVALAIQDAERSVTYADRSGDSIQRVSRRATHADALHQAGRGADAETRFREAEQMQAEDDPTHPLLYSFRGFRYCDLLLAEPERAAWRTLLNFSLGTESTSYVASCRAVDLRAAQIFKWLEQNKRQSLLDIALAYLSQGSSALYKAIMEPSEIRMARPAIDQAVTGLRRSGQLDDLPRGLLTRAWLRSLEGSGTGPESAERDLDEAWEIADRGPMRLFMADIHLYRARLFFRENKYPWRSPREDLDAAEKLIKTCGYHRRDEELADAKTAILG